MALFKLKTTGDNVSEAELVEASHSSLALEQHLECWLEKSPWAIAEEPLLVIGRQTSASVESGTIFPDLLALDKDGNLVITELKKGKAPREVVAQILEYAAWASELSQQQIEDMAEVYLSRSGRTEELSELFCDTFEADSLPTLNQSLRLFIAAEEIPPAVSRVCRFLRQSHSVDVNCVEFSVFETEKGEILVSSEWIVGHEDVATTKRAAGSRWSGDKPVRQVVWEAVQELTGGDKSVRFTPSDVMKVVLKKIPDFNKNTIGHQIMANCVNHTSRHHYSGTRDYFWRIEKGVYRLFDPERDSLSGNQPVHE